MIWTVAKDSKEYKMEKKKVRRVSSNPFALMLLMIGACLIGYAFRNYLSAGVSEHSEEMHPAVDFKKRFSEVCASPHLPIPEYKGVGSFFEYITNPETDHCYSWLEFGGEKIIIPTQEEKQCMDEIRKTKMICFNEEYQMTKDPCLVYSFTKDADQQFERDMHMFSCNVHVFDAKQIIEAEHLKRSEFWLEHAWDISEYPYDKPASGSPTEEEDKVDNKQGIIRRRSLDYITHMLKHEGKIINYLKSDHEGREWILLKQVVMHSNLVDIQQIGVRIHIPTSVNKMTGTGRHEYFRELFQIFQGLSCLGYKYVLGRPAKYYKGAISVPELHKKYFIAYEVNFAKVLNSTKKVNVKLSPTI